MSFETWLAGTHYTSRKKEALTKLYRETVLTRDDDFNPYSNFCKCFIKDEPYDTYKFPRGIFARKDDFKLRVGPIFKLIESELFKLPYFVKKVPVSERARFLFKLFGSCPAQTGFDYEHLRRYIATDYTAFESSFTSDVMHDCEMILYRYMVQNLPDGRRFIELLERVLCGVNDCRFRNISVKMRAGRMSGEMNTSLGNGFTNLMLFMFAMEYFGCDEFLVLVEGDDGIASYLGPKIPNSFYSRLGFNIKLTYYETLNLASFCGQIFDFETFTVITNPIKVLLNFSWVNIKYGNMSKRVQMGLIRSKALSLLYQYPGCPIVQSFALRMIHFTAGYRAYIDTSLDSYKRFIMEEAVRLADTVGRPVPISARQLMFDVFNITIYDQLLLEDYFSKLAQLTALWHPVLMSYIPSVCFEFNSRYVTDKCGPHDVPFVGRGALSNKLRGLIDVVESKNKKT